MNVGISLLNLETESFIGFVWRRRNDVLGPKLDSYYVVFIVYMKSTEDFGFLRNSYFSGLSTERLQ